MRLVTRQKPVISFVLSAMVLALSCLAEAQQPGKVSRMGYLDVSTLASSASLLDAFRQEMSKLGWVEGKNIAIEYRFAEQRPERLPELAADLVRLNVDVIVGTSTPSALAAKKATRTIPIVMVRVSDPVATGLIASLARPGGNITGLTPVSADLAGKRLEILKEVVPKLTRVGVLWFSGGPDIGQKLQLKELRAAALELGLRIEETETKSVGYQALETAFQTAMQKGSML